MMWHGFVLFHCTRWMQLKFDNFAVDIRHALVFLCFYSFIYSCHSTKLYCNYWEICSEAKSNLKQILQLRIHTNILQKKDFTVHNLKAKSLNNALCLNAREGKRLCNRIERYSFTVPGGEICKYDHVAGIALMLQMFPNLGTFPWVQIFCEP